MSTKPRDWPTDWLHLRNDLAELLRFDIAELSKVTQNEVNDEEDIEALCDKVKSDCYDMLRGLELAGAATDPLSEINRKVEAHRCSPLALARV